jgi:TRAP-type C4-dicarboxylate transport system permease small subunit
MKELLIRIALTANDLGVPEVSASSNNLVKVTNTFYLIIGMLAVVFVIIGGIQYVTSSGDPSATAKAKNTILYAIVGIVLALSAFAVTGFLTGQFK